MPTTLIGTGDSVIYDSGVPMDSETVSSSVGAVEIQVGLTMNLSGFLIFLELLDIMVKIGFGLNVGVFYMVVTLPATPEYCELLKSKVTLLDLAYC